MAAFFRWFWVFFFFFQLLFYFCILLLMYFWNEMRIVNNWTSISHNRIEFEKPKTKKKTLCTVRNNIHFVYRNHAIYSNDDVNELRQWLWWWWWCCSPLFHIGRMEVRSVILFCCSLLYIVAVFLGFVFVIFLCLYCCCRWKCFCIDIFISLRPSFFSVLYSMPNGFG